MREDENSLVFASEPLEKGAEWAVIPEQSLLYVVGRQVYTHALT
jgi:predicted glutamine amidotransferase